MDSSTPSKENGRLGKPWLKQTTLTQKKIRIICTNMKNSRCDHNGNMKNMSTQSSQK